MAEDKAKKSKVTSRGKKGVVDRPSVYKLSPEAALNGLFKDYLGPKSPLLKAFEDNPIIDSLENHGKLLSKHQDQQKGYVKQLLSNTTKLTTVTAALNDVTKQLKKGGTGSGSSEKTALILKDVLKEIKISGRGTSRFGIDIKSLKGLLIQQHRYNIDRDLHRESMDMERQLKGAPYAGYQGAALRPSNSGGALSGFANHVFAKGFHFLTGALSEILQKKIFKSNDPTLQENLPSDKWSPQHANYMNTRGQLSGIYRAIFGEARGKKAGFENSTSKAEIKTTPDDIKVAVVKGDEKITKSVDSMHVTLKNIAKQFAIQTEIMEDEADANALNKNKAAREVVKAGNIVYAGGSGGSLLGTAGELLKNAASGVAKAVGELATKVIPTLIPATKNLLASARALALRPIGLAAGTGIIGGAAIAAGYYMDKTSREMMDANTDDVKSQAGLEMQHNRMKRENPKAYEVMRMRERLSEMRTLPQTDANKNAQAALLKQYNDALSENALSPTPSMPFERYPLQTTPDAITDAIRKSPAIAGSSVTDEEGNVISDSVEEMHDGVVSELRDGKVVDMLGQIRDQLARMQSVQGGQNGPGSLNIPPTTTVINSKSSIALQRDAMRSSP